MTLTVRQIIFAFSFCTLLFMQFAFGESVIKNPLLIGWCIFFIVHIDKMNWHAVSKNRYSIIFIVFWLIWILITTFFSHSIPISIEEIRKQFLICSFFIFFLLLDEVFISKKLLILQTILVVVIGVFLSMVFLLIPGAGSILSPMNILYPTYGHSHLAAPLLLVLPLSVWLLLYTKVQKSLLLFLIIALGFFITFGRVAMVVGLVQLILSVFFIKIYLHKRVPKVALYIILTIAVLFVSKIFIQSFFSVITFVVPEKIPCPLPVFERQICKSFKDEPRIYYWEQAIRAVRDFPITGYGPGTFGLISTKYRQLPNLKTLYTHNEYLQQFAEVGIVGGTLFLLGFGLGIYTLYKRALNNYSYDTQHSSFLSIFIFMSIIGVCINNLFDYDWHFIITYQITAMIFAIGLKNNKQKINNKKIARLTKYVFISIISLQLFISLFHGFIDLTINLGKHRIGFSVFPYFYSHYWSFMYTDNLSDTEKSKLAVAYKYSSGETYKLYEKVNKVEAAHDLYVIDPWAAMEKIDLTTLPTGDVIVFANQFKDILNKTQKNYAYDRWELKKRLAYQIHEVSRSAFESNDKQKGYILYEIAAHLDPWSVHAHFLSTNLFDPSIDDCQFLAEMLDIPPEPFGDKREFFAYGYAYCIAQHASLLTDVQIQQFRERIPILAPWSSENIIRGVLQEQ